MNSGQPHHTQLNNQKIWEIINDGVNKPIYNLTFLYESYQNIRMCLTSLYLAIFE